MPHDDGPAIVAEGLGRKFGDVWALGGLTLDAEPGEVIALLGPNGAGKTTTVRVLNGVLAPHAGRCRVLGFDPTTHGRDVRERTGVLTEQGGLDDRLTLVENLVFHARIRGINRVDATAEAEQLLARFGMSALAKRTAQGLSTGERKRVSLARALLHRPEVLFLDEPTSGLDPAATRDVLDLIGGLAAEEGRTVVLCTHFLAEAARLCRRVAILERGRQVAFGRPGDLAAQLWRGLPVDLDLGGRADPGLVTRLGGLPGVLGAIASDRGVTVLVEARDAIPGVVAATVAGEATAYSVVPRPPTLEDVYFALTGRTDA